MKVTVRFFRHGGICRPMCSCFKSPDRSTAFRPGSAQTVKDAPEVLRPTHRRDEFRPAIPQRVARQQSPPPLLLHRRRQQWTRATRYMESAILLPSTEVRCSQPRRTHQTNLGHSRQQVRRNLRSYGGASNLQAMQIGLPWKFATKLASSVSSWTS
jgi:hypothetical protein